MDKLSMYMDNKTALICGTGEFIASYLVKRLKNEIDIVRICLD